MDMIGLYLDGHGEFMMEFLFGHPIDMEKMYKESKVEFNSGEFDGYTAYYVLPESIKNYLRFFTFPYHECYCKFRYLQCPL